MKNPQLNDNLELGIRLKRMGDYENAIQMYHITMVQDPTDPRSYTNKAKILLGTSRFAEAIPALMTSLHLQLKDNNFWEQPINQIFYEEQLQTLHTNPYKLTYSNTFEPKLILQAIKKDAELKTLILLKDNLLFYLGYAYAGEYLGANINQTQEFLNTQKLMLGLPTGQTLRNSQLEQLFCSIGFVFAHINLTKNNNPSQLYHTYLDTTFDPNIENYREFLSGKSPNPPIKDPQTGGLLAMLMQFFKATKEKTTNEPVKRPTPLKKMPAIPSQKKNYTCQIAGVTFDGRQHTIAQISSNTKIKLQRDPHNRYDANAVKVVTDSNQDLGFIPRHLARTVAKHLDQGKESTAQITAITGGRGFKYGVNISYTL